MTCPRCHTTGDEPADMLCAPCAYCGGRGEVEDVSLSPNFLLSELVRSTTAAREGIPNDPPDRVVDALHLLAEDLLQPIRDRLGPLVVTSGYRSPELNAEAGGSVTSAHLTGYAADVRPVRATLDAVVTAARSIPHDQIIPYASHVHLGLYGPGGRQRGDTLTLT